MAVVGSKNQIKGWCSLSTAQTQLQSSAMFLFWWKRLCFITKTHLIKDTTTNNELEIFENQMECISAIDAQNDVNPTSHKIN